MKKGKILIISVVLIIVIIIGTVCFYAVNLTPVSKKSEKVEFVVSGGTSKIIDDLYNAKLIKNKLVAKVYVKLNKIVPLAGKFDLDRKMSVEEIFNVISDTDSIIREDIVKVLFKEGQRIPDYVKIIEKNFGYSEEEIYKVISDKKYLNELIKKYSFLTEDILNSEIYYPLEGYLFPATYEFYKSASIKSIIEKMLDKTQNVLDNINVSVSEKSVHEILTIASIIENEAKMKEDRPIVSQVIYKRLDLNMSLGMDVTTYYGVKKAFSETLTASDLATKNAYNTRNMEFIGLPVGPISNPSETSIEAALNPSDTEYIYFYADVYGKDGEDSIGKLHFAKTTSEFEALIRKYR